MDIGDRQKSIWGNKMSFFGFIVLVGLYGLSLLHIMAGYACIVQKNTLGVLYNVPSGIFYQGFILWAILKST
jgi:hypothetical protein